MKIRKVLLTSVLAVGLTAQVYGGEVEQKKEITQESVAIELTQEEMIEDYLYMWSVIEENYPFLGVVERQGIDYKVLKQQGLAVILQQQLTVDDFYMLMGTTLSGLNYTGHIGVIPYYQYDYMKAVYEQAGESKAWHNEILNQDHVKKIYTYLNERYPVEPGVNSSQEGVAKEGNLYTSIIEPNHIAYMKIDSFGTEYIDSDGIEIEKFYKEIKAYPYLIIDLTDNSGGNDMYWQQNIVKPAIDETMGYASKIFLNEGYYTDSYMMSVYTAEYFEERKLASELQEIDEMMLNNSDLEEMAYYTEQEISVDPLAAGPIYNGDIYVLMDETVYSASESFVKFCKETEFATLVGMPSGGDGGGIDPIIVATPNSGLMFKFSVLYTVNEDGRNNEEFGTDPDHLVTEDEDVIKACVEIIHQENK